MGAQTCGTLVWPVLATGTVESVADAVSREHDQFGNISGPVVRRSIRGGISGSRPALTWCGFVMGNRGPVHRSMSVWVFPCRATRASTSQ